MLQNIYLNLPRSLQNASLSIFGASVYRERFSGSIPEEYRGDLTLLGNFNEQDFIAQTARLRTLVSHCKKYVPFYKPHLRNVDPDKIFAADLDNILPIITKVDVLENSAQFISTHPEILANLKTANTSGSSGTPLSIKYNAESRRINYKIYNAVLNQFGCNYRSKSTTFAGRILYKAPNNNPDRYDFFNRTQYISSYFISEKNVKHYVDALNHWQPEFIDTYPSAIVELLKLANERGLKFAFSPKVILTSSENLSSEARSLIENSLNTTVVDHYGCTEMAINAFSNGQRYYANPRFSILELQHSFDNQYEVVTTGLLNFGMPLLRYKIGDMISRSSSESNYIFDSVDGRLDDVIITPEGKKVGRMDPAFKGVDGIVQSQIVQHRIGAISVYIVLDKSKPGLFDKSLLISNIKSRTSDQIEVDIIITNSIEKGANGKLRAVVSKIAKQ